jgi:hypothetical protein
MEQRVTAIEKVQGARPKAIGLRIKVEGKK